MPGLLRGMARTAVVAGTATAASNRVSRRQAQRWGAQEASSHEEYAAPPPSVQPGGDGQSRVEALKELASLKDQGVLTEEEFAAEKARILSS
jgi:Short C-terminal domain